MYKVLFQKIQGTRNHENVIKLDSMQVYSCHWDQCNAVKALYNHICLVYLLCHSDLSHNLPPSSLEQTELVRMAGTCSEGKCRSVVSRSLHIVMPRSLEEDILQSHPSCFLAEKGVNSTKLQPQTSGLNKITTEKDQRQADFTTQRQDQNMVESKSPRCRIMYDPAVYTRLLMICRWTKLIKFNLKIHILYFIVRDCYNLFKEPEVYTNCRSDCFSNQFFTQCAKALLYKESNMIGVLGHRIIKN